MKCNKRYSPVEKTLFKLIAWCKPRKWFVNQILAPVLAVLMGRTPCAIAKQIELALVVHYRVNY